MTRRGKLCCVPPINPRLTDYFGLPLAQEDVGFAIPFLDQDLPFVVDPFILWKSPSQAETGLHVSIIASLNHLGRLAAGKQARHAAQTLVELSECHEVCLGNSNLGRGTRIGIELAERIVSLFQSIPELRAGGIKHLEELQLIVDGLGPDRVSDITCSLMKSALVDLTVSWSNEFGIPTQDTELSYFDTRDATNHTIDVALPFNPLTHKPILLVPKRWLRRHAFVSLSDYKLSVSKTGLSKLDYAALLNFNRLNFDQVRSYVESKEALKDGCKNDPLFEQIPVSSALSRMKKIVALPTGKHDRSDQIFEREVAILMSSLLYPDLDFADVQVRTDSGAQIRDIIFFNTCRRPSLKGWWDEYSAKQIVFELKNVATLEKEHVNQLNRYLAPHIGHLGIFVLRTEPKRDVIKHIVDIWSGQRKCILWITDEDMRTMVDVYHSKQRKPIEVIERAFLRLMRKCPV